MPYLRNVDQAREVAQARLQKASSAYQQLMRQRNEMITKAREYLYRAKQNENEALYEQGQAFMAQANQLNGKMLMAYQEYRSAEQALSKFR